jgi:hypothetical protein
MFDLKRRIITVVIICAAIFGYLVYNQMNPKYQSIISDRSYLAQSLDELENYSDIIVKAKALNGSETHIIKNSKNHPSLGYTLTPVKIVKVYKGSSEFNLKEIKVLEAYWSYTNIIGEKVIQSFDNYRPLKPGNTYLLFLKHNSKGELLPTCVEYGKYVMNDKTLNYEKLDKLTKSDMEIGEIDELYLKIFKGIAKKYKD